MSKELKRQSLKELAEDWGLDYQVIQIKRKLIDKIMLQCEKKNISQRKLASMVPGLTQDRVSKIFSGQISHMTIDKLVIILNVLNIRVDVGMKKAA